MEDTKKLEVNNEEDNKIEDDDLEEGELKDDDDDDDDDLDDDEKSIKQNGLSNSSRESSLAAKSSSSSEDEDEVEPSPIRAASPSQSSSSASSSPVSSSSVSSSTTSSSSSSSSSSTSSSSSSSSSTSSSSSSTSPSSSSSSSSRFSNSKKPSSSTRHEKLITMRMKLLEARSRELEMKFKKNNNSTSPTPVPSEDKSSTGKGSVKAKDNSSARDSALTANLTPPVLSQTNENSNSQMDDQLSHQGPRTPPDNHVTTLEDEQIEWPSGLIKMTVTQPSIPYSVNPESILGPQRADRKTTNKRKDSTSSSLHKKKHKDEEKKSSSSSPSIDKNRDLTYPLQKYSSHTELDLNSDFAWFVNYFAESFGMNQHQAQHQAYSAIISGHTYDPAVLERWLNTKGYTRFRPSSDHPKYTIIKSQREIVLPNGQTLPPGTIEKIVHPYPKMDSEILAPYYDLY